jgi:lysophospholipase L1-like esterase
MKSILLCLLFVLQVLNLCAQPSEIAQAKRIVFLGDSITQAGLYIDYLEGFLVTRYPKERWEVINLGLSSETVSGLTEPGHAGGKFPRPDLHERLTRALEKTKPDLVFACYGMNDGIYFPLSEERFAAFKSGMKKLHQQAEAAHIRIVHITPPTFDPEPIKSKTLPPGLNAYPSPYVGYNDVLGAYSTWLLQQRDQGWSVIDLHKPMDQELAARRRRDPKFKFAGDGVHPDANGHWLFTRELLRFLQARPEVDACVINAGASRAEAGQVSELGVGADQISFHWKTQIPMPMDPSWDESTREQALAYNRHALKVTNLAAPRYGIYEGTNQIGFATRAQLSSGLNLLSFTNLITTQRAASLFKLVQQREHVLRDAWLSDVGHKRPGMGKALPLEQAKAKAADLTREIEKKAAPVELVLKLKAASENP